MVFLVGGTSNETLESQLDEEVQLYGDVIRSNSYDSYDNLTLKTMSMLQWTIAFCPLIKYLLKVDDDMSVNVPNLLSLIQEHQKEPRHIYGRIGRGWPVIRNKTSKYYVSPELYAPKTYPNFCTGPAYLLTSDVLSELYDKALQHKYFKLEDVFLTGIVANELNITRKAVETFVNKRIEFNTCAIKKVISIHMVSPAEQYALWKKQLGEQAECPLPAKKYVKILK